MKLQKSSFSKFTDTLPWLVLILGFSITGELWNAEKNQEQQNLQNEFNFQVNEIEHKISERIHVYEQLLYSARGLFLASESVECDEFKEFVKALEIEKHYPGIQGLGFSKIIPHNEKQKHIQEVRQKGFPDYKIFPDGDRLFFTSIIYLEPFNWRNQRAFGYDMYSEKVRRLAMDSAANENKAILSGKVELVQETDDGQKQAGFLIYLPIYRNHRDLSSPENRQANLLGWVYAPFRANYFIQGVFSELNQIHIEIYDGATLSPDALLFSNNELQTSHLPQFATITTVEETGHRWTIRVHANSELDNQKNLQRSYFILVVGSVLSFLLTFIVHLLLQGRKRTLRLAEKMNQAFIESNNQLKATLDAIPDLLFELNADGQYVNFHSPRTPFVKNPEKLVGQNIRDILPPKATEIVFLALEEALEKGYSMGRELSVSSLNNVFWFELSIARKTETNQKQPSFVVLSRDITQRKQMEKTLQQESETLNTLIHAIPDLIWLKNTEGVYQFCNNRFEIFFGAKEADILGKSDYDFVAKDMADFFRANDRRVIQTREIQINEEMLTFTGKNYQGLFETIKAPLFDENDNVIGVLGISRDISERKRAEINLAEGKRHLQAILDSTAECVKIVSHDGLLLSINGAGLSLIEADSANLVLNQSVFSLISAEHQQAYQDFHHEICSGKSGTLQFEIIGLQGTRRWMETQAVPFRLANGEMTHLAFTRDISDSKEQEQNLQIAKDNAEKANRSKSEFLANMSHEIRTPMNAILGFSEILAELITSPAQKYYLDAIHRSGKTLLQLINDILDLSKIEAGKMTLQYKPVSLKNLLNDINLIFSQQAIEKSLELSVVVDETCPPCVLIDEIRLRQILLNLVGNALKFTKEGSVEITLKVLNLGIVRKTVDLQIDVRDSGMGIPKAQQEKIFAAFTQQDNQSLEYGGTGLGLTICQRLLHLMNGRIIVKSTEGEGSCFSILLKGILVIDTEIALLALTEEINEHVTFLPAKILLVDDMAINRELIRVYLAEFKALTFVEAQTGKEAIERMFEESFDLILMDRRLPDMDGDSVCQEIKALKPEVPIIMISASIMKEAGNESLVFYDSQLSKPVNKKALVKAMSAYLKTLPIEIERNAPLKIQNQTDVIDTEKVSELLALLETYKEKFREIEHSGGFDMNFLIETAQQLGKIADNYHCGALKEWANTLTTQADLFDIVNLTQTLSGFEQLCDRIAL